jgi:hypothetical protein
MVLGAVIAVVALALPRLAGLPRGAYAGVCAGILGVGSVILAVRGWRVANRLLRERHGGTGAA